MRRSRMAGSILIAAMVVLVVLMLLIAAAIAFTGKNREASAGKMQGDQVAACADAARRHLLSKLRMLKGSASSLRLVDVKVPHGDRELTISTSHFDGTQAMVQALTPAAVVSDTVKARDLSNAAPGSATLGGQFYSVVVKCEDPGGRMAELEFAFRYGL